MATIPKAVSLDNTVGQLLRQTAGRLSPVAGDLATREAESIFEHLLAAGRTELYLRTRESCPRGLCESVRRITDARLSGRPLPYVLGCAYFFDHRFAVNESTLIPRPDTEILIENILATLPASRTCRFLDVGTGSGNIVETLVRARPHWHAHALDISPAALKAARTNVSSNVRLLGADRLEAIKPRPYYDFIVSNPPYIARPEWERLEKSVRGFEPYEALVGGEDGLAFYRYLSIEASRRLKPGGLLFCEIGYDQRRAIEQLLACDGWREIYIGEDLAGRPRVVRAGREPARRASR